MSTNQCVNRYRISIHSLLAFSTLLASFAAFLPVSLHAAQTVIVDISLNQEKKGAYFVKLTEEGDFLVKSDDLKAMGFVEILPKPFVMDGEPYISLTSFAGVTFVYNESTLSVDITAVPELLPRRVLDFTPPQPLKVYYPGDSSAFLNYRLDYFTRNSFKFESFGVVNELGIRNGNFLLLTDSAYTKSDSDNRFVRLSSRVIYDRRQEMQRLIAGDLAASSGDLGASLNLGGVSFSKLYRINPYFINRPTVGLTGLVSLPSDLEVYLNGMRIRTDRLAPGEFDLRNITGSGGASLVEVVVRDPFGREQHIRYPFYFTDILLKKGLHEYSYNMGALRREFGSASNHYGKLAFSGFHNYGITDSLTFGLRGEWAGSDFNFGPQASYLFPRAGTITLSLSGSHATGGKGGIAGLLGYSYQGRVMNARLFTKGFSRDYATIDPDAQSLKTAYEANVGAGYSTRKFGSLNFDFFTSKIYQGDATRAVTTSYTRNLTANSTLFVSYKRELAPTSDSSFFVGFNYYPGRQINLAANVERSTDTTTETMRVQKNQPLGEGVGFQAAIERSDSSNFAATRFSPSVQLNAPHGIYAADYAWADTNGGITEATHLALSGAFAYAGRTFGLTRPVSDSFALVKVGDIEGVTVKLNNQDMARTDKAGKAFVTDLGSFNNNQISINDKDVPIDYLLSAKLKQISPPFRSGSCVLFDAAKLQAVTGILTEQVDGRALPIEYGEITIVIDDKPVIFQTGKGGEFYLDNYSANREGEPDMQDLGCTALDKTSVPFMKPGKYAASVEHKGGKCVFALNIPAVSDPMIDVGKVTCVVASALPSLSPGTAPPAGTEQIAIPSAGAPPFPAKAPAATEQVLPRQAPPQPNIETVLPSPALPAEEATPSAQVKSTAPPPDREPTAGKEELPKLAPLPVPGGDVPPAPALQEEGAAPQPRTSGVAPATPSSLAEKAAERVPPQTKVGAVPSSPVLPAEETSPQGRNTSVLPDESEPASRKKELPAQTLSKNDEVVPPEPTTASEASPEDGEAVPVEIVVHFRFDSVRFSSRENRDKLMQAIRMLKDNPLLTVSLEGHTDQLGSDAYNLKLGARRALRVKRELRTQGFDQAEITALKSFGKRQPLCRSLREVCRKKNRRVVIRLSAD